VSTVLALNPRRIPPPAAPHRHALALEFRRELAVVIRDCHELDTLNHFWRALPSLSDWSASAASSIEIS
jgi:hypothetical protein